MNRQVITIGPGGIISGLQVKPGKGVDLRQFGKASIKRASVVEWNEHHQAWYIQILPWLIKELNLRLPGVVTMSMLQDAGMEYVDLPAPDGSSYTTSLDGIPGVCEYEQVLLWEEYEDAVKVEIAYLDALRLKGEFPRG